MPTTMPQPLWADNEWHKKLHIKVALIMIISE